MINLVGLAPSPDSSGAQSAATAADISRPLPAGKASAQAAETAPATGDVSISAEAVRRLELAAVREQEQAAMLDAVRADAELAARMVRELAYRREIVVVPPTAYSDLAAAMYVRGTSPASNAATIQKVQADLERARMSRIAVYEMEKAKGTPPAKIYEQLSAIAAARPVEYPVIISA